MNPSAFTLAYCQWCGLALLTTVTADVQDVTCPDCAQLDLAAQTRVYLRRFWRSCFRLEQCLQMGPYVRRIWLNHSVGDMPVLCVWFVPLKSAQTLGFVFGLN